jgi:hypothetical protein
LAGHENPARSCRSLANWLVGETPNRIASCPASARFADYVFAFHDGDEIGPKMLARIARQTGLTPDDL